MRSVPVTDLYSFIISVVPVEVMRELIILTRQREITPSGKDGSVRRLELLVLHTIVSDCATSILFQP